MVEYAGYLQGYDLQSSDRYTSMLRELKHTGARKGEDAGTVAETDEAYIAVHLSLIHI